MLERSWENMKKSKTFELLILFLVTDRLVFWDI